MQYALKSVQNIRSKQKCFVLKYFHCLCNPFGKDSLLRKGRYDYEYSAKGSTLYPSHTGPPQNSVTLARAVHFNALHRQHFISSAAQSIKYTTPKTFVIRELCFFCKKEDITAD